MPLLGGFGSSYASTAEDDDDGVTRRRENQGRAVYATFERKLRLPGEGKGRTGHGARSSASHAGGLRRRAPRDDRVGALQRVTARWASRNNCMHFAQPTVATGNGERCEGQKTTAGVSVSEIIHRKVGRALHLTRRVLLTLTTVSRHRTARAERHLPRERGG